MGKIKYIISLICLFILLNSIKSYAVNAKSMRPSTVEITNHYVIRLDYDSEDNLEFLGKANIGTAESASNWQIRKFTYATSPNLKRVLTIIQYAGGQDSYNKIWNDRSILSYK